jgi:hypothetical protein
MRPREEERRKKEEIMKIINAKNEARALLI